MAVTVIPLQSGFGFFWSAVIELTSRSALDAATVFVAASPETTTSPHAAPTAANRTNLAGLIDVRGRRGRGGQTIAVTGSGECTL